MVEMFRERGWKALFLAGAIFLLALNLRPGATSIGPVLEELSRDLGMSATQVGLVGALPGLIFAPVGLGAAYLARKCGITGSLVIAAGAIAVGLTTRVLVGGPTAFFALTILAFVGMGIGNILILPLIRQKFPFRIAALTTIYTTALTLGSTIPPLLSAPIAEASSWRSALGIWGATASIALLVWIGVAIMQRGRGDTVVTSRGTPAVPVSSLLRSPKAIALAVFFGMQSMQAYVQFAWVPQMFRDGGLSPTYAGVLLALVPALALPGSLLMPTVIARVKNMTPIVVVLAGLLVVGYVGILVAPASAPLLWAVALGLSGTCFPMAIALITARSRDVRVTAPLSALVQSIGYVFAACGPFLIGIMYDAFGAWDIPLWFLIGSAAVLTVSGIIAARPGYVDDEIGV